MLISDSLDKLPDLPQKTVLTDVAQNLWQREDVVAIWLGGSFGSGKADRYSDVDLRVAVQPEAMKDWHQPDYNEIFGERVLWAETRMAQDDAALHNLLLDNADAYDLWIQTPERKVHEEPKVVLGCREPALQQILAQPSFEPRLAFDEVNPEAIRAALEWYWANHVKHEKVLHRNLYMLARDGLYLFGGLLLRLQFILATGKDCGNVSIPPMTIHTITPVITTLRDHYGDSLLDVVGVSIQNRADCVRAIEKLSQAIAAAGRDVAARFRFEYPTEIEQVVLASWAEFKEDEI